MSVSPECTVAAGFDDALILLQDPSRSTIKLHRAPKAVLPITLPQEVHRPLGCLVHAPHVAGKQIAPRLEPVEDAGDRLPGAWKQVESVNGSDGSEGISLKW